MIAQLVQGNVEGNPAIEIHGPARIEEGTPGTISFLADAKYESFAYTTRSSALLVSEAFQPQQPISVTLIRVADVRQAVAQLLQQFDHQGGPASGIHPTAIVEEGASVDPTAQVGRLVIIDKGARIGARTIIHDQVTIGPDVTIGADCVVYPGVRIYRQTQIGDRCTLHSNTVLGSDGFGFVPNDAGVYEKVPQVGHVILEDDVEVGSNCVIDRATMGATVIETGVKLDNLIQIAHNVRIGAHTVIAAQAGVAGSTRIGPHCQIGGQVGIVGHTEIAEGTRIQAQSGIASAVKEPHQALFGSPAIPYGNYIRSYAVFKRLPEMEKRLRNLEKNQS